MRNAMIPNAMIRWAASALLCAAGAAVAAEAPPPRVGDDTRAWLALQTDGSAATDTAAPMPGEVADKVYQRYLKTFENTVPEQFERESFTSGN